MNRYAVVLIAALACGALMAAGCCDKFKDRIAALEQENTVLQTANGDLKKDLAQGKERCDELAIELESKETELANAKAELSDLKAKKPTVTTRPHLPPDWRVTATGAKITLGSDILFRAGRATLSSKGAAKLKQIAGTIQTAYPDARVRVYGFTDSDPIVASAKLWRDNLDLSANRAMAVTRKLRKLEIPAEKIETIGMGATNFVAANRTKAGKAKNRRVEIVVIKP